jgi:hypothetical protein
VGPHPLTPTEIQRIESALRQETGQPVTLVVWAKTEVVVTRQRYDSVENYREATLARPESAEKTSPTEEGTSPGRAWQ